tara:strand:+ start:153 stop:1088 length:936 start_codon:yes stop_codon:yes gene_type:complete
MFNLQTIKKFSEKLFKRITKLTNWEKALILIILILPFIFNKSNIENFQQKSKFVMKENENVFDDFYCSIYDDLVYDVVKNEFEFETINKYAKPSKQSRILDIGSGTGHHVNYYNNRNIPSEGLDNSSYMINKSRKNFPRSSFKHGNALDTLTYMPNKFTHALCLYFTIYYIKDKKLFLENCYKWLMPRGILVLHLVDRDMFDPMLNAGNPLLLVSPQKYAKQRITNTVIKFNDFLYNSDFKYKGDDNVHFIETFKDDKTGNVRKHDTRLYMETQKEILKQAKDVGFIQHAKIDMINCEYEYQYLYFLYKPE